MSFDYTKDLNGCHKGKLLKTYLRKSNLKIAGWEAIYWFRCEKLFLTQVHPV